MKSGVTSVLSSTLDHCRSSFACNVGKKSSTTALHAPCAASRQGIARELTPRRAWRRSRAGVVLSPRTRLPSPAGDREGLGAEAAEAAQSRDIQSVGATLGVAAHVHFVKRAKSDVGLVPRT